MTAHTRYTVVAYPGSRDSTYLPRLLAELDDRVDHLRDRAKGVALAIEALERGDSVVLHVNWEEFVFADCSSEAEAQTALMRLQDDVWAFQDRGGRIVWTVHNGLPHRIPFLSEFRALRAFLAEVSDVILVHNTETVRVLAGQCALDRTKLQRFTYPSYLGWPESRTDVERGLTSPIEPRIQLFGTMRLQKNYSWTLEALAPWFLRKRELTVRISGRGPDAATLLAENLERRDIHWDIRRVPDAEVPALLRTATCAVVAYRDFLTSGVAMLVMSAGGVLVGPDSNQLREMLPKAAHRFLFAPERPGSLRRAVDNVLALSDSERADVITAGLDAADAARPAVGAAELAAVYEGVLAR